MTPREAVILTRYVEACCPQQKFDDYTPDAWHDLLGDLDLDDCKTAVRTVAQRQPFVSPSEIRAELKRVRAERIGPPGPGLSPIPPPVHPDAGPKAYLESLRAQQARLASGIEQVPAIEGGQPTGYDDNPHVQKILDTFRGEQDAAARRRAEQAAAESQAIRAYVASVEQLLALPDHGEKALAAARDELLGDEQAAQGFPLLHATAGLMDEHKIHIRAAWLVTQRDGLT
jgi:hypothetical protein